MRQLKRVRVLTESPTQFQLGLPKRKVRQVLTPSDDDKYYVRINFEDDCIKLTPVEMMPRRESSLESSIEELKKQLDLGGENANGT